MIIAILAAVAVPRLLSARYSARDSALIRTLAAVRQAIALYSFENSGELPGSGGTKDTAQFKRDVENYLQGPFAKCTVGAATGKEADVLMSAAEPFAGTAAADEGWAFNTIIGVIHLGGGMCPPTRVSLSKVPFLGCWIFVAKMELASRSTFATIDEDIPVEDEKDATRSSWDSTGSDENSTLEVFRRCPLCHNESVTTSDVAKRENRRPSNGVSRSWT